MIRWWKNLLIRLAESNKKNFGSERLDCCNLNKSQSQNKEPEIGPNRYSSKERINPDFRGVFISGDSAALLASYSDGSGFSLT